jgi:Fuc2NAc and GlcNAc transferase
MTTNYFFFLLLIYIASLLGTFFYRSFAVKNKIFSYLNERTLHAKPTPRGGGLVFSLVFVFSIIYLYFNHFIKFDLLLVFGIGGAVALFVGYVDDVKNISSLKKLALQFILAFWILFIFKDGLFRDLSLFNNFVAWGVGLFSIVWLINAYNFIDGIDGMAISGAILILSSLVLITIISSQDTELLIIFSILLASCLGFLLFNWPKATIFMGDSGSIFLGYIFSALIIYSTMLDKISFFTWLVIFGYYLSDTVVTSLIRLATIKKWYGTHRSHAYQNLARITKSHLKVTTGVIIFHIFWLFPLSICTIFYPQFQLQAAALALLPGILWAIKFGPLYSNE